MIEVTRLPLLADGRHVVQSLTVRLAPSPEFTVRPKPSRRSSRRSARGALRGGEASPRRCCGEVQAMVGLCTAAKNSLSRASETRRVDLRHARGERGDRGGAAAGGCGSGRRHSSARRKACTFFRSRVRTSYYIRRVWRTSSRDAETIFRSPSVRDGV